MKAITTLVGFFVFTSCSLFEMDTKWEDIYMLQNMTEKELTFKSYENNILIDSFVINAQSDFKLVTNKRGGTSYFIFADSVDSLSIDNGTKTKIFFCGGKKLLISLYECDEIKISPMNAEAYNFEKIKKKIDGVFIEGKYTYEIPPSFFE